MIDEYCFIEIGTHEAPYWTDPKWSMYKSGGEKPLIVCNRHKKQYEERNDPEGPHEWVPYV